MVLPMSGLAAEIRRRPLIAKTAWPQWAAEGLPLSRFLVTCSGVLVLPRAVRPDEVWQGAYVSFCHTSSQELVL